jgi:hypothetical protein
MNGRALLRTASAVGISQNCGYNALNFRNVAAVPEHISRYERQGRFRTPAGKYLTLSRPLRCSATLPSAALGRSWALRLLGTDGRRWWRVNSAGAGSAGGGHDIYVVPGLA